MPHTPDTHLTITPEHVYINGKQISVAKDALELSNPSPAEVQTVTLTIHPTTVAILNENGEATTLYERPETPTHRWLTPIHNIPYAWKLYDQLTKDNQADNTDNTQEERSGLSEIYEKYLKTQKRTLTTEKQHEWMNEFKNRR